MKIEERERREEGGEEGASLRVELARNARDIAQTQRLRHRVFFAARSGDEGAGIDRDRFDLFCDHLVVRGASGEIVGTYRMLPAARAVAAGGFYSQHEFDLDPLQALLPDTVEIGRACVDPRYRSGAVIGMLLGGLIAYVTEGRYRYVIGCASIPAGDPDEAARACRHLLSKYPVALARPVQPRRPFPVGDGAIAAASGVPALIRTYLRLGAVICGPPAFDPEFGTADLLLLLDLARLNRSHVDRVRRAR